MFTKSQSRRLKTHLLSNLVQGQRRCMKCFCPFPPLVYVKSVIDTLRELGSGIVGEMELEEAEKEVSTLAAQARKALEENDR